MGRASKQKGIRGELEFAALLSAAIRKDVARKLGAARDGGDDVALDLRDFPQALMQGEGVRGFSFEVKRREALAVDKWMAQALENAVVTGKMPVVVFRRNGMRWSACLDLNDFFKLLRAALNVAR